MTHEKVATSTHGISQWILDTLHELRLPSKSGKYNCYQEHEQTEPLSFLLIYETKHHFPSSKTQSCTRDPRSKHLSLKHHSTSHQDQAVSNKLTRTDTQRRPNTHQTLTKPRENHAAANHIFPGPQRKPRHPPPISTLNSTPLHPLHDRCWLEHGFAHQHRSRAMGLLTLRRWLVLVRYYHCVSSKVPQSLAQGTPGWE
jgi:hypothetical protein